MSFDLLKQGIAGRASSFVFNIQYDGLIMEHFVHFPDCKSSRESARDFGFYNLTTLTIEIVVFEKKTGCCISKSKKL